MFKELNEIRFSHLCSQCTGKSKEEASAVNSMDVILSSMQNFNYKPTQYFSAATYHEIKQLIS